MQKVRGSDATQSGRPSGQGSGALSSTGDDNLGVTFYTDAPDAELSVREFEEVTCDRLKVLHALDRLCGYDTMLAKVPELRPKLSPEIHNAHLDLPTLAPGRQDAFKTAKAEFQRKDSISHFVLRLAFCKTRDAREWFVRQEQRLFVLRFDSLGLAAQEAFMREAGMTFKRFDQTQWDGLTITDLQDCTAGARKWGAQGSGKPELETIFYELPFFDVHPSLIATRRVMIKQGVAFIPTSDLKLILAARFKERLTTGLDRAFQGLPTVLSDPRVGGFIRLLQEHGLQLLIAPKSNSEDVGEKLSLDNFDELLKRSFPPCMRRVVEQQRERKKHLKHAGRLQLRPFLKDCGFTFDESIRWWRDEITKDNEVDITSFEKNYTYDVEHTYGKKGHFQGQNSFGCPKIIGFPAETAGQCHGCLFKLDMPIMKQQLHKWKVPEASVNEMEKLINNGKHYQLACIEYFKCEHRGNDGDGVGNSPGDFFRESSRHYLKKKEKEAGAGPNKIQASAGTPAITAGA
jgi:DNA primase large subunit